MVKVLPRLVVCSLALAIFLPALPRVGICQGNEKEGPSRLTDERALEFYNDWLRRLRIAGLVAELEGLEGAPRVHGRDTSWDGSTDVVVLGPVEMNFAETNGAITWFWNDLAVQLWQKQRAENRILKPRWTRDEALARAETVLKFFLGPNGYGPSRLSHGLPAFSERGDRRGVWAIEWSKTLDGHRFEVEGVAVTLHEDFGLISYGVADVADDCPTEIKISRSEAIRIARELVDKALPRLHWDTESEGVRGLRKGPLLFYRDVPNAGLVIVHPRPGFEKWGGVGRSLATTPRVARLAYVIEFEPKEGHLHGTGGDPGIIILYVDAQDGRIIGGDWDPTFGE